MTEPRADAGEVAGRLRARHIVNPDTNGNTCRWCTEPWPCDGLQAADALEAVHLRECPGNEVATMTIGICIWSQYHTLEAQLAAARAEAVKFREMFGGAMEATKHAERDRDAARAEVAEWQADSKMYQDQLGGVSEQLIALRAETERLRGLLSEAVGMIQHSGYDHDSERQEALCNHCQKLRRIKAALPPAGGPGA